MDRFSISDIDKEAIEKSNLYLSSVLDANKQVNLTSINEFDEGKLLHIEDSLSALPEIEAADGESLIDLGSGGGFPGVPIAIATGLKTNLVDSSLRKVNAVNDILKIVGLDTYIAAIHSRIEELARKQPESYSIATARALASLPVILELASPLLEESGTLVCWKAKLEESELDQAKDIESLTGMRLKSERRLRLSDGETERTVLAFEKFAQPKVKLPRKTGKAQKQPLQKRN